MRDFDGVTLDDLNRVYTMFKQSTLVESDDGKMVAELVRRSLCHYPETLHVNVSETHLSYIQNVHEYCHSYWCRTCGDAAWRRSHDLRRHEHTCEGGIRRIYPGGVYHSKPSEFQRLRFYDKNIRVAEAL